MARQRGRRWQADVREGSTRHRPTFTTRAEAEAWEERAREAVQAGRSVPDTKATSGTLEECAKRARAVLWADARSSSGLDSRINIITRHFGPERQITSITKKDLTDFIDELRQRGLAVGTLNGYTATINGILKQAAEDGVPFPDSSPPTLKYARRRLGGRIREVSDTELGRLVRLLRSFEEHDMADLVIFLRWTGCRVSEARNLKWVDVTGSRRVTFWDTKNGDARTIPLPDPALQVLQRCRGSGKDEPFKDIKYANFIRRWNQAKDIMGLTDDTEFVPHALRHTSCSHQVRQGVDIRRVRDWHGHKSIQMTMRYAHLSPDDLDDVVSKLGAQNNTLKAVT